MRNPENAQEEISVYSSGLCFEIIHIRVMITNHTRKTVLIAQFYYIHYSPAGVVTLSLP